MTTAAIFLGHLFLAFTVLPLLPIQQVGSLPYLLAGIMLHVGYQYFLLRSHTLGDLTQVFHWRASLRR